MIRYYTCTLVGAKWFLDNGAFGLGGNGRTNVSDSTILFSNDKYNYPDNLPIVAAKGGPGGKPELRVAARCVEDDARTPTRHQHRLGHWARHPAQPRVSAQTCYANFLPVTRAIPEPPSIRDCLPGPAIGPVTAPGMPPYGASLYGPGGVPLWPGLPPAGTPPPVPVPGTPVAPRVVAGLPPRPVPPIPEAAPTDPAAPAP